MNTKIFTYLRVIISAGLLFLLVYIMRGQYGVIVKGIRNTNPSLLLTAFIIYNINIALTTLRLKVLLRGEHIKMPFLQLNELTYIGFFFNNFMPSAIGGDIIKAYYTGKITGSKAKSYVSVFMDRLTGLFSFAGIGLIALVIGWDSVPDQSIKRAVLIFVILCFVAAFVCLNSKMAGLVSGILSKIHFKNIGEKLLKVYNMVHAYKNRKMVLLYTIIISIISQAAYFYVIYLAFTAYGIDVSLKVVFLLMPVVCVVALLPSLGGLGLREGAIVALFGPIVGKEQAFGVSTLLLGILFAISILGGIVYIASPQFKGAAKLKPETQELI